ncbi:hypothetical protein [Lagierella massiliensis]|uniref:hypothetical protein n=1 Tax=Lagierella massiliensis TaxID=1689303 RepID=UPI0006D765F2|nr:hypothetical protein [Lagierella massiliensis]
MKKKYNNLNSKKLYEKFVERYDEKYRDAEEKDLPSFLKWFKSYSKSGLFIVTAAMILAATLCIFLDENLYEYIVMAIISSIFFLICAIPDYFLDFTDMEKQLANNAIDEILQEENINLTETNLDKILQISENAGSRESRTLKEIKNTKLYSNIKELSGVFIGLIIGYASSLMNKSDAEEVYKSFKDFFDLYLICIIFLVICTLTLYAINKITSKKKNLYLEVLEDKKLTQELKKEE